MYPYYLNNFDFSPGNTDYLKLVSNEDLKKIEQIIVIIISLNTIK